MAVYFSNLNVTPNGPGVFVDPTESPASYEFAVGPWNEGPAHTLQYLSGISMTFNLQSPDTVSFSMLGLLPDALLIHEWLDDCWIRRNGELLRRFILTSAVDNLDVTSYEITFTGTDYEADLDWHLLQVSDTAPHTDLAGSLIRDVAWSLVEHANGQQGMGVVFGRGNWPTAGPALASDFQWQDGLPIYSAIRDKLTVQDNGDYPGDFWIDDDLTANLDYPQRGSDRGVTLDYGGAISKMTHTLDIEKFANQIRQSSADWSDHITIPVDANGNATIANPENGLRGKAKAFIAPTATDVTNNDAALRAAAQYNLTKSSALMPEINVTLRNGFWRGKEHIWLGDTVNIVAKIGRLNITESVEMRVQQLTISLDGNGGETVSLNLNWPNDPTNDLKKFASIVTLLNRR